MLSILSITTFLSADLNSLGFSNDFLAWFTNYFSEFSVSNRRDLLSRPLAVSMEVPQGSILGPTLRCIHQ